MGCHERIQHQRQTNRKIENIYIKAKSAVYIDGNIGKLFKTPIVIIHKPKICR